MGRQMGEKGGAEQREWVEWKKSKKGRKEIESPIWCFRKWGDGLVSDTVQLGWQMFVFQNRLGWCLGAPLCAVRGSWCWQLMRLGRTIQHKRLMLDIQACGRWIKPRAARFEAHKLLNARVESTILFKYGSIVARHTCYKSTEWPHWEQVTYYHTNPIAFSVFNRATATLLICKTTER